jgi:hypothetical protein
MINSAMFLRGMLTLSPATILLRLGLPPRSMKMFGTPLLHLALPLPVVTERLLGRWVSRAAQRWARS